MRHYDASGRYAGRSEGCAAGAGRLLVYFAIGFAAYGWPLVWLGTTPLGWAAEGGWLAALAGAAGLAWWLGHVEPPKVNRPPQPKGRAARPKAGPGPRDWAPPQEGETRDESNR